MLFREVNVLLKHDIVSFLFRKNENRLKLRNQYFFPAQDYVNFNIILVITLF